MKCIKIFFYVFLLSTLCYLIFLVLRFLLPQDNIDLCKEGVNHEELFTVRQKEYLDLVSYYLSCGEDCNINFIGKGCGEGKQCYRNISDEVFKEKIKNSNIRSISKINSNLIELISSDAVDNTSDHFGIGTRYLPCYRYLFIYNSSLLQKESNHLLNIAKKLTDNWYVTLDPN